MTYRLEPCKLACKRGWQNFRIQTGKWALWRKEAAASGKHAGQGLSLPTAQLCALGEGTLTREATAQVPGFLQPFQPPSLHSPRATFLSLESGLCPSPPNLSTSINCCFISCGLKGKPNSMYLLTLNKGFNFIKICQSLQKPHRCTGICGLTLPRRLPRGPRNGPSTKALSLTG